MFKFCPFITCQLTDEYGNVISPYAPNAISYTILPYAENDVKSRCHFCEPHLLPISIEGYVSVFSDKTRISPPIPFSIMKTILIYISKKNSVTFQVKDFHCCAIPICCQNPPVMKQIRLLISIDTVASSQKDTSLRVPQINSNFDVIDCPCIYVPLCDKVQFRCGSCINYQDVDYRAEIYQYNTIADGIKRTYRNSDELTEYGDRGILSPDCVSYYNVFVNGVMQPKTTYTLKEGELTFKTQEVPAQGRTIIILFTTWKNPRDQIADVTVWQYNAIADGTKKIYTNLDEIKEYGKHGIPSPCEISYCNLYINGVLQPSVNYCLKKGILKLTTDDAPTKGAPIVLESIVIRDKSGNLFRTKALSYNSLSKEEKIYTDQDAIPMYGIQKIPDPRKIAFQNLFVNSVIQPHVNFHVHKGYLILNTTDAPTKGAPVTLQSVKNISQLGCCNLQISAKALAQFKKVYVKVPCMPATFNSFQSREQSALLWSSVFVTQLSRFNPYPVP